MLFFNSKICVVSLLLLFVADLAHAQLVANPDVFGVPFGQALQVEALGVLENDTLNGNTDVGLTAELVDPPSNGTLFCPGLGFGFLCADGSFVYTPGPGFSGTDVFTYKAFNGSTPSNSVTVTLTACVVERKDNQGDATIYSCWVESSYTAKLAELGYGTFLEGFEGTEWDGVRLTFDTTNSAAEIISQGIRWTSNHPGTNDITTGSGAARTGSWGGYDPLHGYATGTVLGCNTDPVPDPLPINCLYHDGLSGTILPGGDALQGVGGYITGSQGDNIAIILNGTTQINLGKLPDAGFHFLGVIDATVSGFTGFEFRELDGKVGQRRFIFGDDFRIATSGLLPGCNLNTVSGVIETATVSHEACETLVVGPSFTAENGASISLSSGWDIWFMPGFSIKQGATLDANVCGQSLCMTSALPMPYGCHSCVNKICDIDSNCCNTAFDQACLDRVNTDCGLVCE
jgi:hypothetical protein